MTHGLLDRDVPGLLSKWSCLIGWHNAERADPYLVVHDVTDEQWILGKVNENNSLSLYPYDLSISLKRWSWQGSWSRIYEHFIRDKATNENAGRLQLTNHSFTWKLYFCKILLILFLIVNCPCKNSSSYSRSRCHKFPILNRANSNIKYGLTFIIKYKLKNCI